MKEPTAGQPLQPVLEELIREHNELLARVHVLETRTKLMLEWTARSGRGTL